MACYIASNDNRVYVALESQYGSAAAITAADRVPAVKLGIRHTTIQPKRRDKTGGRTYTGLPSGLRKKTSFDLATYMTSWDASTETEPVYGPLFQASLGAQPLLFAGATIAAVLAPNKLKTATANGLAVGQAVRSGGEIRFVESIEDTETFFLNAPFSTTPEAGSALGKTVTYQPGKSLPSATLFDYWSPATAVQRILAGSAVDQMKIQVNGDFHQFGFAGIAADLTDSTTFSAGLAGLTTFPDEPVANAEPFSLVPGNLGQAWFGVTSSQFYTVISAEVSLRNNIDPRDREFGQATAGCIAAGQREVSIDLKLVSDDSAGTSGLYQAAMQRSPVSVMFQLGQLEESLCGVYMPAVIPEVPEFDDAETRLQWRFRNSKAQGSVNDELIVAFG